MNSNNAPKWFIIVAALALVWNLFGVMAFVMHANMSPDAIAALPEAERALYESYPMWALIAFACAVFGGVLGSLLLVLKKSLAVPVLLISLIGVLVQMGHSFLIARSHEVYGPESIALPILVLVIAIYLVMLAGKAKKRGWTD